MSRWGWSPYVPVAQRRAEAKKEMDKLRRQGQCVMPVEITGRTIARSFWGKGWCEHLESFSDFANRLPRGRTYVRNGSVCHLDIREGEILATVSGSELYSVRISIAKLAPAKWAAIKSRCTGQVGSLLELLQGRLSAEVMTVVAHRTNGLFPLPGEIKLDCSCPDLATMCKHVAAVLYGVGHRLDTDPGLLFTLRGVDPQELISAPITLPEGDASRSDTLADADLGDLFGIEVELEPSAASKPSTIEAKPARTAPGQTTAAKPAKAASKPRPAKTSARTSPAPKLARLTEARSKPGPKPFSPTGPNIQKLRRNLNLTVDEFAARIGASPATVRRWEGTRGKCTLHTKFLQALQALHLNSQCDLS